MVNPMKILLLLMLAIPSYSEVIQLNKDVDGGQLRTELEAAGCTVAEGGTMVSGRTLILNATGCDATPVIAAHVPIDRKDRAKTAASQALALAKKLKAGTATNAEKDALLLRLCFILLSQEQ